VSNELHQIACVRVNSVGAIRLATTNVRHEWRAALRTVAVHVETIPTPIVRRMDFSRGTGRFVRRLHRFCHRCYRTQAGRRGTCHH